MKHTSYSWITIVQQTPGRDLLHGSTGGLFASLHPISLGFVGMNDFWEDVQLIKHLQFAFLPCLIFEEILAWSHQHTANKNGSPSHDFRESKLIALSRLFVYDEMLWSFHFGDTYRDIHSSLLIDHEDQETPHLERQLSSCFFFPIPSDPQILQIQELGGDAWHLSSLEAQEGIHWELQGSSNGTHFGGIKQYDCVGNFEGFPWLIVDCLVWVDVL